MEVINGKCFKFAIPNSYRLAKHAFKFRSIFIGVQVICTLSLHWLYTVLTPPRWRLDKCEDLLSVEFASVLPSFDSVVQISMYQSSSPTVCIKFTQHSQAVGPYSSDSLTDRVLEATVFSRLPLLCEMLTSDQAHVHRVTKNMCIEPVKVGHHLQKKFYSFRRRDIIMVLACRAYINLRFTIMKLVKFEKIRIYKNIKYAKIHVTSTVITAKRLVQFKRDLACI